jgi:transposase-like protein
MNSEQKRFPQELKESVVRRYLSTDTTVRQLADEIGSSTWSVRSWVREYQAQGTLAKRRKRTPARPDQRSAPEKLRLLLMIKGMPDDERGAALRREGLHDADIERWEREAVAGLQGQAPNQQQRIAQLERETLHHKKRLKEAEALLILQKKVQALWVDEDDDTSKD